MKKAFRTVQFLANLSIIIIAFLLALITIKQFSSSEESGNASQPRRIPATATSNNPISGSQPEKVVPVGKPVPINDFEFGGKKTLVMYLSTKCRYCTESASFYKKIIEANKSGNVKLIAVLPQDENEAREYFQKLGLQIDEVRQSSALMTIGIRATPSLLIANDEGIVTDYWIGKLDPEREEQVITKLND